MAAKKAAAKKAPAKKTAAAKKAPAKKTAAKQTTKAITTATENSQRYGRNRRKAVATTESAKASIAQTQVKRAKKAAAKGSSWM